MGAAPTGVAVVEPMVVVSAGAAPRGLAAVLAAARRAADGAVEIDGDSSGAVYLVNGCVAFAETPAAPAPATGSPGRARFVADARHWADPDVRLDADAVRDLLALRPPGSVEAAIRSGSVVEPAPPRWSWRVITPR